MNHWNESSTNVFGINQLASGLISKPPPLFTDFILDRTLTMVSGPPHTGKSMLMLAMVIALDSQLPLLGKFHPKEVKRTLAFLQDAPTWDYAEQVRKLCRGYGLTKDQMELLESTLVVNRGVHFTDPKFLDQLKMAKAEHNFDVLCLDAFWTMHGMGNINDSTQAGHAMNMLKRFRDEFGVAVIFNHHERKPSQTDAGMNRNYAAAGSFVISAAVDFNIPVSRKGKKIKLELPKARGGDEQEVYFEMVDVEHPQGEAIQLVAVEKGADRKSAILNYLAAEPKPRKEIVALVATLERCSTARAGKITDNELTTLLAAGRVAKGPGYGIWRIAT